MELPNGMVVPDQVVKIALWLTGQDAICAVYLDEDADIWSIDYQYQGRIWPTIRIPANGRVVFPKGTDFELMMKFLEEK